VEYFLEAVACFGGDFHEMPLGELKLFLYFLFLNCAFFVEIVFVANEEDEDVVASVLLDVVHPDAEVVEAFAAGDVVDEKDGVGVAEVAGDETFEAFLASSVPELEADGALVDDDVFGDEVDAYGGLHILTRTLCMLSNSFLMNRLIIELFPTAWSPTNTTLNFIVCFLCVA
jgi:hypothetical protein